jgi:hypothetical protein
MYFIKLTSSYSSEYESIEIKNTGSRIKRMELLFQEESGLASFGAKVVPSLKGVDPSFMNSVVVSYLKNQVVT